MRLAVIWTLVTLIGVLLVALAVAALAAFVVAALGGYLGRF